MASIRWVMSRLPPWGALWLGLALAPSASVMAAAPSGPSLRVGLAFHTSEATDFRANDEYDSSGFAVGGDYQLTVDSHLSLNPFLSVSFEESEDLLEDPGVSHTLMGLEGRFWLRDLYFGPLVGLMGQGVDGDTYEENGSGLAYGLVAGTETDGGTYLEARFVQGRSLDVWSNTDVDVSGLRLNLGYRFR